MKAARILIVDDHEIFRRGLKSLLESQAGWGVCGEAVNGMDALEQVRRLAPDVVTMDITMPGMNGLEATRAIVNELPATKILMVSQHEAEVMKPRALEAGARDYVSKSDVSRDLVRALKTLVDEIPEGPDAEEASQERSGT
jgi:DNA-binding NarL/FixJ family response regulator